MAASQILKNTVATLEVTFSVGNADGAVTVTILRADGSTLVAGGATTQTGGAGRYVYSLAAQSELDSLTATWTGTFGGAAQSVQTFAEVVGGYLFPLADLRAFGDKVLANATTYPDADLRAARERITDMFQDICGVSFIPRYEREVIDGTGSTRLWLKRKRVSRIIAASANGTAITGADLTALKPYPTGRVERPVVWPWPSLSSLQNVTVAYEHGWPSPPADIARVGMVMARYDLVSSDISDRMISFDNDLGSVRLSVPGRNFPTGIPIVDATLARYDETDLIPA